MPHKLIICNYKCMHSSRKSELKTLCQPQCNAADIYFEYFVSYETLLIDIPQRNSNPQGRANP